MNFWEECMFMSISFSPGCFAKPLWNLWNHIRDKINPIPVTHWYKSDKTTDKLMAQIFGWVLSVQLTEVNGAIYLHGVNPFLVFITAHMCISSTEFPLSYTCAICPASSYIM